MVQYIMFCAIGIQVKLTCEFVQVKLTARAWGQGSILLDYWASSLAAAGGVCAYVLAENAFKKIS